MEIEIAILLLCGRGFKQDVNYHILEGTELSQGDGSVCGVLPVWLWRP